MATAETLPACDLRSLRHGLDPYGWFESAHHRFGDAFTVTLINQTWMVLAHPDAVRELHQLGPDDADSRVANRALIPLLGRQSSLLLDGVGHLSSMRRSRRHTSRRAHFRSSPPNISKPTADDELHERRRRRRLSGDRIPGEARGCNSSPDACCSSTAARRQRTHTRLLLHECRRRLRGAHRHRLIADRVGDGHRRGGYLVAPGFRSRSRAVHVLRIRLWRAARSSARVGSVTAACRGKGILGRIRPSLPRRLYEDGHLLQLERCHDVQQHSGVLAAGGGGGRAPRRRVDWSCGSACRRWPGARSGAAC